MINSSLYRKRIALCAQPFGFGPASKAATIATKMAELFPATEIVCCMDRISREYMIREGLWCDDRDISLDEVPLSDLRDRAGHLDAAVVILDPELASYLHAFVPTYFVDSLGFMWGQSFFEEYPAVREATRYFVQDAFGAARHLRSLGVRNVEPVGGIVDAAVSPTVGVPEIAVNLGGLLNIFSEGPIRTYVDGVANIIAALSANRDALVLTSQHAIAAFETLSQAPFPVRSLPHRQALWVFSESPTVLTSPGLTTLLELTNKRVAVVPLPPQNMSQALIIRNIVESIDALPDVWYFLAESYPLAAGIDEDDGVRIVQENNAELLFDPKFINNYCALANAARSNARPLPMSIVPDMNGAETVCATVMADLEDCARAIGR